MDGMASSVISFPTYKCIYIYICIVYYFHYVNRHVSRTSRDSPYTVIHSGYNKCFFLVTIMVKYGINMSRISFV